MSDQQNNKGTAAAPAPAKDPAADPSGGAESNSGGTNIPGDNSSGSTQSTEDGGTDFAGAGSSSSGTNIP